MIKTPLGLVGLHFIQRAAPGFHGRVLTEAPGPWARVEVCSWQGHKPVASRVFSAEDLRACDFYPDRKTWLVAVREVDAANAKKATA